MFGRGRQIGVLVDAEGADRAHAKRVVHQRGAVQLDRRPGGVPAHPVLLGHRGHRAAELSYLAGDLGAGPDRQHLAGGDAGDLLGPGLLHTPGGPTSPAALVDHQAARPAEAVQITQVHLDPVLGLGPSPTRRAHRFGARRLHVNDHLARHVLDLEHHQPVQSQHLLCQSATVRQCQGPPRACRQIAVTMSGPLAPVVDTRSVQRDGESPVIPEEPLIVPVLAVQILRMPRAPQNTARHQSFSVRDPPLRRATRTSRVRLRASRSTAPCGRRSRSSKSRTGCQISRRRTYSISIPGCLWRNQGRYSTGANNHLSPLSRTQEPRVLARPPYRGQPGRAVGTSFRCSRRCPPHQLSHNNDPAESAEGPLSRRPGAPDIGYGCGTDQQCPTIRLLIWSQVVSRSDNHALGCVIEHALRKRERFQNNAFVVEGHHQLAG